MNGVLPPEGVNVVATGEIDSPLGIARSSIQAVTRRDGAFTLRVPTEDWPEDALCEIEVWPRSVSVQSTPRKYPARMKLEDGMRVELDLSRSPHGSVSFLPERPEGRLRLDLMAPGERYPIATGAIGPDGSFVLDFGPRLPLVDEYGPAIGLRLSGGDPDRTIAEVEVDLGQLRSTGGASVEFRLCQIELRISGVERKQTAMVSVRAPWSTGRALFQAQPPLPATLRFSIQADVVNISVGSYGLVSQARTIRLQRGRKHVVEFALRPETDAELVHGVVRDARGRAVERAFVEAFSVPAPEASHRSRRFTNSDREGRFALNLTSTETWSVSADHEEEVGRAIWQRGAGALELQLRSASTLRILEPPDAASVVLVATDGSSESWENGGQGIFKVVPGDYRLFVRSRPAGLFGDVALHFEPGERKEQRLQYRSATWAGVRVNSESGDCSGLGVLLDAPDWPPAMRTWWGRAWTDPSGACELFLGDARAGVVHVSRDGADLGGFEVQAGSPAVLRVP